MFKLFSIFLNKFLSYSKGHIIRQFNKYENDCCWLKTALQKQNTDVE